MFGKYAFNENKAVGADLQAILEACYIKKRIESPSFGFIFAIKESLAVAMKGMVVGTSDKKQLLVEPQLDLKRFG